MDDFLKKVLEGSGITPSEICLQSFNENFKGAINIEWFKRENCFEAIFYKENLEHIAIFSLKGVLMEYRLNLPLDYLPEPVKNIAASKGEVMNAVMRNKGNMIEYEVILMDKELNRYLITLSEIGKTLDEKKL